jgi:hypothetical protein
MATPSELQDEQGTERGLSRRSLLSRSATGVGIALTGNLAGWFGTQNAIAVAAGPAAPATGRSSTTRTASSRCPRASRTRSSPSRA